MVVAKSSSRARSAISNSASLSCEYASLAIATGMLGDWVSEYDFEAVVPLSDNPHWGYRGDITGSWGNSDQLRNLR